MSCASRLPEWIRFGREVCGDPAQAERREWWFTNGRGAYAAVTGCRLPLIVVLYG